MFGFFKQRTWGISDIRADLLKQTDIAQVPAHLFDELLERTVRCILFSVFGDNAEKFNQIEKDMLTRMCTEKSGTLEELETYLRAKISRFDKSVERSLAEYYKTSKYFDSVLNTPEEIGKIMEAKD